MDNLFEDLDTTPEELAAHKRKSSTDQKFPCPECLGTGKYQGARVHQDKTHCFACKGKGFFATDPRKLAARRARKAARKGSAFLDFHGANEEVIRVVSEAADWSDFARSLTNQLHERKPWSDQQLASAQSMAAKLIARRESRAQERKAAEVSVDLTPIRTMFETAAASGYKKPTYRAEGLVLNRAPDYGNNPGALYVKSEAGDYLGKIIGTTYKPNRAGIGASDTLLLIAQDPLAAALRYGQRTGRCACCGRELTKHTSIDAGIGPVCKSKWGL